MSKKKTEIEEINKLWWQMVAMTGQSIAHFIKTIVTPREKFITTRIDDSFDNETIVSELEYWTKDGKLIHSDLDADAELLKTHQYLRIYHSALTDWLKNSRGTGGYYIKNQFHHFANMTTETNNSLIEIHMSYFMNNQLVQSNYQVSNHYNRIAHETLDEWIKRGKGTGGFYIKSTCHRFENENI